MQPLFIGPFDLGVHKNLEPFMIPEKAYPSMLNAFVFRGRIKKKMGYASQGRLRRELVAQSMGNISAVFAGFKVFNIFTGLGIATDQPNAQPEKGNLTNITITIGAPISQTLTDTTGTGTLTVTPAGIILGGTINYANGDIILNFSVPVGASAATFSGAYYPSLPVMGLRTREQATINQEQTIAFDTIYAYRFVSGHWEEVPSTTPTTWTGSDSDFFWTTNYSRDTGGHDLFWATNFNTVTPDPIRYYESSTPNWFDFTPPLDGTGNRLLITARLLIPYKDRLVALNTYEQVDAVPTNQFFPQRARWSQNGSPINPLASAWRDDIVGRGGFIDAPTNEQIVSAGFIKDNLVVYFERSTWQLVYTSNEILPFIWQRINQELGSESTFSSVVFDNGLIAFGNVGLHVCNGVSVERIDAVIPDVVFDIQNQNEGPQRVYAIRDFLNELVYFTYPDEPTAPADFLSEFKYPNRVLVYNYRNDTFSFFQESFTCYGYFQRTQNLVWADLVTDSGYSPWSVWKTPWNSGLNQAEIPDIVAGNQQGFVVRLTPDNIGNAPTLSIYGMSSDVIISPNHNLNVGTFIQILNAQGSTNLNDGVFRVDSIIDENGFIINGFSSGTYIGNGVIKVLSNIDITTKMFNPYWAYGKRYRLRNIEYLFDRTTEGEVTVNTFVDTSDNYSVSDVATNPCVLGTSTVLTRPEPALYGPGQLVQNQIWHRMYYYTEGETFQIQITLSDAQMSDIDLAESGITLHGMVLHFESAGDFL